MSTTTDEPIPDTQPRPGPPAAPLYLGDGVYVELQNEGIVLTTHDGIATTNTVFLEGEVLANLLRYVGGCATPLPSTPMGREVVRASLHERVSELRRRADAAVAAYSGPKLSLDMAYLARAYHAAAFVLEGALKAGGGQ